MVSTSRFRALTKALPLIALCAGLSGCGRDADLAEQVMEAKQAAQRAEAAQHGAEQALARIAKYGPVADAAVVEQEPDPGGDVRPDVDPDAGFTDSEPTPQT